VIQGMEHGFGLAGLYTDVHAKQSNGAVVSMDGGATWKDYDMGFDMPYARYGSFPSPTTWFIAAGIWPELSEWDSDPEAHVLSSYVRRHNTKGYQFKRMMDTSRSSRRLLQSVPYEAVISRTTDGGKTFQVVYNNTGNFYFNDISCFNTMKCWAVGEAESDSPTPGVRIIATADGGNTWTEQMYINDATYSLMDVQMVTEKEGWAVGGILARSITGAFYHTTDGMNWKLEQQMPDEYAMSLSFVHTNTVSSGYLGWASAITLEGQSSVLGYK